MMELSQVLSRDGFHFYSEEDPEDELEQMERQRELQAELDAALDPAMIEEEYDDHSNNSHDSDYRMSASYNSNAQATNNTEMTDPGETVFHQRMQWPATAAMAAAMQQTSTPRDNYKAPPLATPSTASRSGYGDPGFHPPAAHGGGSPGDDTASDTLVTEQPRNQVAPMYFTQDNRGVNFGYGEQSDSDGYSNDDYQSPRGQYDQNAVIIQVGNYDMHAGHYLVHGGPYALPPSIPVHNFNHHLYQNMVMPPPADIGNYSPDVGNFGSDYAAENSDTPRVNEMMSRQSGSSEHQSTPPQASPSMSNAPAVKSWPLKAADKDQTSYKVRYNYNNSSSMEVRSREVETGAVNNRSSSDKQEEFLSKDGEVDGRKLAQLQILYDLRVKKIEELTIEMETYRDEKSREIRILNHQLSAAQGEKNLAAQTIERLQQSLMEEKTARSQVDGQVAALQLQMTSLKNENEEIAKKLISAESTIASLNSQLSEATSTETWTRLKQQHETVVTTLKRKHETEIFHLKEQLDKTSHQITDKNGEIVDLRKRIADSIRSSEQAQIDRNETINRLARTLQESQDQYSKLLESGASQELSRLRIQLQDAIAGKSIMEDVNNDLKKEIEELTDHLTMYESATHLGILPNPGKTLSSSDQSPFDPNDSYTQLCIKNPHPTKKENLSLSNSETLKNELERYIMLYGKRRQQASTLQTELKSTKKKLNDVTIELESNSKMLQDYRQKMKEFNDCQPGKGIKEAKLEYELEKATENRQLLEKEIQNLNNRLEEASSEVKCVNELNNDLHRQMSEIIKEHDQDKRRLDNDHKTALDRSRVMLLEHQEETLKRQRMEIMGERDQRLEKMRKDYDALEKELVDTKELYVEACHLKDSIANELNEKWTLQLQESKVQWELKSKDELDKLKLENEKNLNTMKLENETQLQNLISENKQNLDDLNRNFAEELEHLKSENKSQLEKNKEIESLRLRSVELENLILQKERDLENLKLEKEKDLESLRSSVFLNVEDKETEKHRWRERELERLEKEMADKLLEAKEDWTARLKDEVQKATREAEELVSHRLQQSFDVQLRNELMKAEAEWERTREPSLRAEIEMGLLQSKMEASRQKDLELQAELENARKLWRATDLRKELDCARDEWTKTILVEERRTWETTVLRKALGDAAFERSREVEAVEAQCRDEVEKVREEMRNEWCKRLEEALAEQERRNKAEMENLVQMADEHIKREMEKANSVATPQHMECQARLAECQEQLKEQAEFQDRSTSQFNSKLQKAQKFLLQMKSQYAAKLSEAEASRSQEVDKLHEEVESWKAKFGACEREATELKDWVRTTDVAKQEAEKELGVQRQLIEGLKKEVSRLEKLLQHQSGIQESSDREHATVVDMLRSKLVTHQRSHESVVEEIKQKHAVELETLKERMKKTERSSDMVSTVQSEILEEVTAQYLDAFHKIREEVLSHMTQTSSKSTENMRQILYRERRQTAKRLRKYYLRCLDRLLQKDFSSSFRAYALRSMEDMLDRFIDRINTPSSLVSSEFTTPRLQDATQDVGLTSNQTTPGDAVGRFDGEWSSGSSYRSFAKRLPDVSAQKGATEPCHHVRPDCVTPTVEHQADGEALSQNNLYFGMQPETYAHHNSSKLRTTSPLVAGQDQPKEMYSSSTLNLQSREFFSDGEGLSSLKYGSVDGEKLFQRQNSTAKINRMELSLSPTTLPTKSVKLLPSKFTSTKGTDSNFSPSGPSRDAQNVTTQSISSSVAKTTNLRYNEVARSTMATDPRVAGVTARKTVDEVNKGSSPVSRTKQPSYVGYSYTSLREQLLAGNVPDVGQFTNLKSASVNSLSLSYPNFALSAIGSDAQSLPGSFSTKSFATSSLSQIPSISNSDDNGLGGKAPSDNASTSRSAAKTLSSNLGKFTANHKFTRSDSTTSS